MAPEVSKRPEPPREPLPEPPVAELLYCLKHSADLAGEANGGSVAGGDSDIDEARAGAILHEAAQFARDILLPLEQTGSRPALASGNGVVTMPPGWREAYHQFCAAGWPAVAAPKAYGGQGLPVRIAVALTEIWNHAGLSFGLLPVLSQSVVAILRDHGRRDLQERYLPKLVSGEWTGQIVLTALPELEGLEGLEGGPDLGGIDYCRAEPAPPSASGPDGSYLLHGRQSFIPFGEHDLAENIVHLVWARLPEAPSDARSDGSSGNHGLGLFLVPKFLAEPDGRLGARNDIVCTRLERTLGLHASPVCTMALGQRGGARGWLISKENQKLVNLLARLDDSRLQVGVQGVAVAERALQQAMAYASQRQQTRGSSKRPDSLSGGGVAMTEVTEPPQMRRMIMAMRAKTAAARAICYRTAEALDLARNQAADPAQRERALERAAILMPLAKFFGAEVGVEVTSTALQVLGSVGYLEEAGLAQLYRDARILPLYQGDSGMQALDLVTRKIRIRQGKALEDFVADLNAPANAVLEMGSNELQPIARRIAEAVSDLVDASERIREKLRRDKDGAQFAAAPYCMLMALATGGSYLLKAVVTGRAHKDPLYQQHLELIKFYAEQITPMTYALKLQVARSGKNFKVAGCGDPL